ncbi:MAG: hypothetical protein ACLRFI_00075 [Alphaproteobacteria bacterium]
MSILKKLFCIFLPVIACFVPSMAFAEWGILDKLDFSTTIPLVLDTFMSVAANSYSYFVGNGNGIVYLLIWGFLLIYISSYVLKMFFPQLWVSFIGLSGGGEIDKPETIAYNIIKPAIRAIVAVSILLPVVKPKIITEFFISPFLEVGSFYTTQILKTVPEATGFSINFDETENNIKCESIVNQKWISDNGCKFLVQPIHVISAANNKIVKQGFNFITQGLSSFQLLNIISGFLIVFTFVSCNVFMAMLVIQAIFNFGMALILYPFNVVSWVAKKDDAWLNMWPPFSNIIKSLQQIIITMIACAFILCVNIAVIQALFHWNSPAFISTAAAGAAQSNAPSAASAASQNMFGEHSMIWLSSLLTFFVMKNIFDMTKQKLKSYLDSGADGLYNKFSSDAKKTWSFVKSAPKKYKKLKEDIGIFKK